MPLRTKTLLILLMGCLSGGFAQEEPVAFSVPGGFYEDSFTLALQCSQGNHIRYTTNGSLPSSNSPQYTDPLPLNESLFSSSDIYTIVDCIPSTFFLPEDVKRAIVIRAAVFNESDSCIGPVTTNSYFIRSLGCDFHGLPVMSIALDSVSLFDYETGIFIPGIHYDLSDSTHTGNYFQRGKEWERLANVEFYESDNSGINQRCGLRTHGGKSRRFQQKGMRLYAREEYGEKRFNHPFFESTPINSFKRLNLHPFRCSHWLQTGAQEYLSQTVASNLDVESLAVRQTVVFINGEYWGVYTMEESPDERYLEDHFYVDIDKVNIIKYWCLNQHGDSTDWTDIFNWFHTADLSQPEDSAYAFSKIDVPNYIDYTLFETFTANLDWPQNNTLQWQAETGAPFRWFFFDGDGCFTRFNFDAINNALNNGGNSLVLRHFLENDHFRNAFSKRYHQLLGTCFNQEYLLSVLDQYQQTVEGEIAAQSERFLFPTDLDKWYKDMEKVYEFIRERNSYFENELLLYISVDENPMTAFNCHPNPSSGSFSIQFNAQVNYTAALEIIDTGGRILLKEPISITAGENCIPIRTDLSPGLYLIRLDNFTTPIIIQ